MVPESFYFPTDKRGEPGSSRAHFSASHPQLHSQGAEGVVKWWLIGNLQQSVECLIKGLRWIAIFSMERQLSDIK